MKMMTYFSPMAMHKGLTYYTAIRRADGLVHKLQGGGPGMRDDDGRPVYDRQLIWCRDDEITGGELTNDDVTCKCCLNEYASACKQWGRT